MEHRVELLAPAGNPEGFWGALHAGADAVYLAGERFGARAYADNFTTDELLACIRYAHILGRRVYLTVNTLVKENEFDELYSCLSPLYDAGLDGAIVQDIGVFLYIKRHFPTLRLHVSTQMTLTGGYGASLLRELGASRVVPARELSLSEIRQLKERSGLEVETFIHGAMCYCYSGQCLFSSILGGRSGNRGRCAQPCRLPYRVERGGRLTGECYPLSLKDLCTIEHLPELIDAGIDSFKIEGRMKKPEYTAGVTAVYRKYIDLYYREAAEREAASTFRIPDGSQTPPANSWRIEAADLSLLANLYIRSRRQDGYYFRHNGRDMATLHDPSYGSIDEEILAEIRTNYLTQRPKYKLDIKADFPVGQKASVSFATAEDAIPNAEKGQTFVTLSGDLVNAAVSQPLTEDNIRRQLCKLGDTLFEPADIAIRMDENVFYSLKALNELRRQAVVCLEDKLIAENGFARKREDRVPKTDRNVVPNSDRQKDGCLLSGETPGPTEIHVSVRELSQLNAVSAWRKDHPETIADCRLTRVYVESDLLSASAERDLILETCRKLNRSGVQLVLALPPVLRMRDMQYLQKLWECYEQHRSLFTGFLVRSLEGIGFLKKMGCDALYADAGFYVWNRETLEYAGSIAGAFALKGFCLPYELNADEQRRLLAGEHIPCEKVIYGRIPLMITANCVANTIDGCGKSKSRELYYLNDRYHKRFPVLCCCEHCFNIIYNCLPLSLHGKLHRWRHMAAFRLDFTIEEEQETYQVLQYFLQGAEGAPPYPEYTAGHEKRGAE